MRAQRVNITGVCLATVMILVGATPAGAAPIRSDGGSSVGRVPVAITLTLADRNPRALSGVAMAVSTPGNAEFGRHLTRQEVRARFGAPADRVARVSVWARVAGFDVVALDSTGTRLTVTGSAAAAQAAFGVSVRAALCVKIV